MNRKVFLVLAILWASFIFYLSHQPASISSGHSNGVIKVLTEVPVVGDVVNYMMVLDVAEFIVRKSAHMFAYAVLSILVFMSMYDGINDKKLYLYSLGFSFLYACSDEYHQTFIEGRSGEFRDVMVDSLGASIGLLGLFVLIKFLNKKKATQ